MTPATADPPRLLLSKNTAACRTTAGTTELVRGRVVEVPQPYPYHGYVCMNIGRVVDAFVRARKLGRVMTNDSGVITERGPDTVRGADVCFYSFARIPPGPFPEGQLPRL